MIMKRLLTVFFLLFAPSCFLVEAHSYDKNIDDEFVVVLDAGHGGHDPGNLGNGYLEKDIALKIVLKVGAILARHDNIKVIYTRNDDTFVDLFVRGEIANKANADLFVSVHCDSHSSDAYGAGTFVLGLHANKQNFEIAKKENSVIYLEDNYETRYADYNINSPESIIGLTIMQEEFLDQSIALAKEIQDNFSHKLKRKNREVKQAGFIVLHQTFMPSVLVETGFLTNDEEGAYLNSKKGQSEMGLAIAEAILKYKNGSTANIGSIEKPIVTATPEKIEDTSQEITKSTEEEFEKNPSSNPIEEKIEPQRLPEKSIVKMEENSIENKPPATIPALENKEVLQENTAKTNTVTSKSEPPMSKKSTLSDTSGVIFKVQLMATTKDVALLPSNFNGLDTLTKESFKQFKRYMFGNTNSYETAQQLKEQAGANGYPGAYIVAYNNGKRISTGEALKLISQ